MKEYILVDKKVVAEPDSKKWGKWMEDTSRHVADTLIKDVKHSKGPAADDGPHPEIRVSTVFLGLDHSFGDVNANHPLIFETMIFCDEYDEEYQRRCYTWEQAEDMHMAACKLVIMGEDE